MNNFKLPFVGDTVQVSSKLRLLVQTKMENAIKQQIFGNVIVHLWQTTRKFITFISCTITHFTSNDMILERPTFSFQNILYFYRLTLFRNARRSSQTLVPSSFVVRLLLLSKRLDLRFSHMWSSQLPLVTWAAFISNLRFAELFFSRSLLTDYRNRDISK